jgi:outer membrane protein assembly factor BamB
MHRLITALLMLLLVISVPRAAAQSQDWPRWRGPEGNGISLGVEVDPKAISGGPKIAWKASLGMGFSSMAVKGDRLYCLGNTNGTDTVFCLEAGTGRKLWSYSYACAQSSYPGPRATPTVDGGTVYTLSREGHLFALDAATGKVRWAKHLVKDFRLRSPMWDFAGSVVVAGDRLILNAGTSGIALDKATGAKIWDSGPGPGGYATPVLTEQAGKPAAVIFGERSAYGVDIASGSVLWSFPWQTGSDVNASDPVVLDGKVFVASAYGKGCALYDVSGARPAPVWRNNAFETHFSSFVALDGYIYGIDGDAREPSAGVLRCLEVRTGATAWSTQLGFGSLVVAGSRLVVLTSTGTIVVAEASPAGFRELARCALPRNQYWTPPALAQGRLYVRNLTGDLFAIDVSR